MSLGVTFCPWICFLFSRSKDYDANFVLLYLYYYCVFLENSVAETAMGDHAEEWLGSRMSLQ